MWYSRKYKKHKFNFLYVTREGHLVNPFEIVRTLQPQEDTKQSAVASAADKLTSLSIAQQPPVNQVPKPKKLSIPGIICLSILHS